MVYNSLDMEELSFSPLYPAEETLQDPFDDPLEEILEAPLVVGFAMMSRKIQTNG